MSSGGGSSTGLGDVYAPKLMGSQISAVVILAIIMIWMTMSSLSRGRKYNKMIARYQQPGSVDAIPSDIMQKLSMYKGMDISKIGTWITLCYGTFGLIMLMVMNE